MSSVRLLPICYLKPRSPRTSACQASWDWNSGTAPSTLRIACVSPVPPVMAVDHAADR